MEIEQMRIRMGEMAAEIERLHSVIDEANAQEPEYYLFAEELYHHESGALSDYVRQEAEKLYARQIPAQQSPILRDYEEILSGQRELARELDVLLNGDGAAKLASLCDVVSQVAQIVREKGAPLLQQSPVMAIDERTNEFGEPEAVYLQLHDPDDGNEKSHGSNYRADGVSWCWHPINENDVRYIRADIVQQSPAVAVPDDVRWLIDRVRKWGIENTGNEPSISCFHRALDELVESLMQSPRITEQDARAIANDFWLWSQSNNSDNPLADWDNSYIINKLNKPDSVGD